MDKGTPLLVVDVQKAFFHSSWGSRNNHDAEENIAVLIRHWRSHSQPVIFIQHVSDNPASLFYINGEGVEFMENCIPKNGEAILRKKVNSAFIGTDLYERLTELDCKNVVITGLTTNHCVETTTRMAGNYGFNPILVEDACATFDRKGPDGKVHLAEDIHQMTMVNLHEEFADIVTSVQLLQPADVPG
ncbi:cysteine hydrolase family protein [Pseudalkalibacillus salsuginis]|uniref:cysteine hydrolase family protein n=1 Tax=Pseudalkalibacillus salsuginis TaxID=2910972 RepID=UPI001F417110|nr:cysteine hydrolase family protein [Pseudalkalibacillus salsuginis]MCF6410997.1 cysteine hydrolase [Pseudalkalibacillus salsuginis]